MLDDPHGEFMVEEVKGVGRDDLTPDGQLAFWYTRYALRQQQQGPASARQQQGHAPPGTPATPLLTSGGDQPEVSSPHPLSSRAAPPFALSQKRGFVIVTTLVRYVIVYLPLPRLQLDVPVFLAAHADAILTTGKYLNVMRECGQPPAVVVPPTASSSATAVGVLSKVQYDAHGRFALQISAAHSAASASLLRLLVGDRELLPLLRSIKHYFLLDQVGCGSGVKISVVPQTIKKTSWIRRAGEALRAACANEYDSYP